MWRESRAQKRICLLATLMLAVLCFDTIGINALRLPQRRREQRYQFTGIVKSVDKPKRRATIKHDKVEGLMDPMTMPFLIKDEKALNEIQPGDRIKATLVSTDDGAQWLEKVLITGKVNQANASVEPAAETITPSVLMGESGPRTPPPSRFDADPNALYTCSMHLDYRAAKSGKCPRCGMALVSIEPGIPEEFDLQMNVLPKIPQPGKPLNLRFGVFNPRTGAKVTKFGLMHDRPFHLFLISQDLSDFQHIHPRQLADGSFAVRATLQKAGLYKVYTDIYPLEGAPQVLQTYLPVAGWTGDVIAGQAKLTPDKLMTKVVKGRQVVPTETDKLGVNARAMESKLAGDLKVELAIERPPLFSGQKSTLKFHLTDPETGQPVHDLIPYLGAWGHMLILSEDQAAVVHSHPEEQIDFEDDPATQRGGPSLSFDALFPAPGNYRIWTQFLRGRQVFTVSFDVHVERVH